MSDSLKWGKRWDPGLKYSPDLCCLVCDWRPKFPDTFGNYTVGIDSEGPRSQMPNNIYIQIVECPKDFNIFWMHTNKERLLIYKELYPLKFKDLDIKPENKGEIKMK
jgi:hypothetical protein